MGRHLLCFSAVTSLLVTGCIIPEAPEYGQPRQTPVIIIDTFTDPDPRSLILLNKLEQGSFQFSVKVRSEDAGENLVAALFANYKHENSRYYGAIPYEPSTLDKERTITLSLTLPEKNLEDGCHTFTLMVTHESEWDYEKRQPRGTLNDLDSVTWFARLGSDSPPPILEDCPNPANQSTSPTP